MQILNSMDADCRPEITVNREGISPSLLQNNNLILVLNERHLVLPDAAL